jgi:hypothetical protein
MAVRVVSSRSQQPLTVNALLQNPLIVPERILKSFENQFVMDRVLRNAGEATGGAVQFSVSSPQFADSASEIVAEKAEIPLVTVSKGDISTKPVQKRALAVAISEEMRKRNNLGEVERQIAAVRNTIVRDIDGAFVSVLTAAITLTRAATAVWSGGSATIRKDILAAKRLVRTATVTGTTDSYLGYEPDTLLLSPVDEANLLASAEFQALIFGSTSASNVSSLSQLPDANILGLRPLVSVGVTAGTAYVVTSKEVGGYADEFPLQSTELYEVRPNELWRSDTKRSTVGFIDQPKAAASITGI